MSVLLLVKAGKSTENENTSDQHAKASRLLGELLLDCLELIFGYRLVQPTLRIPNKFGIGIPPFFLTIDD